MNDDTLSHKYLARFAENKRLKDNEGCKQLTITIVVFCFVLFLFVCFLFVFPCESNAAHFQEKPKLVALSLVRHQLAKTELSYHRLYIFICF